MNTDNNKETGAGKETGPWTDKELIIGTQPTEDPEAGTTTPAAYPATETATKGDTMKEPPNPPTGTQDVNQPKRKP